MLVSLGRGRGFLKTLKKHVSFKVCFRHFKVFLAYVLFLMGGGSGPLTDNSIFGNHPFCLSVDVLACMLECMCVIL